MTNIIDTEYTTTEQPAELTHLTLGKFLEDLSKFPQDSAIVVSIAGINMTIPLRQAIATTTSDGKDLTVLLIDGHDVEAAMAHAINAAQQEAISAGATN